MQFSDNVAFLEPSATLALAARARELVQSGRSIVDLSTGEPAYDTPEYAARAGIDAIRAGKTGYPPTSGVPELRDAVATYLTETTRHGAPVPSEVLVSNGVKHALFNCLFCLFGSGDEVLVPAPYWSTYPPAVRLTGAEPVIVETRWEDGFDLDRELLEARRTEATRGLVINSPGNPTGAVYSEETLEAVADWCAEHEVWLLSDEIYRRLCWTRELAPSLLDLASRPEHSVVFTGASKAFCMPGWRIGFAVGPEAVVQKASDLQSQTTSGAATPSQYAAVAAFGDAGAREEAVDRLREVLLESRDAATAALEDLEALEVPSPEGAIYLFARLPPDLDSATVAERLLTEGGVAGVPGDAFGAPGFLRFNFSVRPEVLDEGIGRIRAFFSRL